MSSSFAYSRKGGDSAVGDVHPEKAEALLQRRSAMRERLDYAAANAVAVASRKLIAPDRETNERGNKLAQSRVRASGESGSLPQYRL